MATEIPQLLFTRGLMVVKHITMAMRFLITIKRSGDSAPGADRRFSLETECGVFAVDEYDPISLWGKKNRRISDAAAKVTRDSTITVIHGMHPHGCRDNRIQVLCHALASAGFRVLAPQIDAISQLQVEVTQVSSIEAIVSSIADNPVFSPNGKIAVLAPSFSGGMCLAAAASAKIRSKISAICSIGGYANVDSVMSYMMGYQGGDNYGRLILLKKILGVLNSQNEVGQKALDIAIEDNLNQYRNEKMPAFLQSLSATDRDFIDQLMEQPTFRQQLFLRSRQQLQHEISALNVVPKLDDIEARVFLFHGLRDDVIPATESRQLYLALKARKKLASMVVTPLLSHGDTQFEGSQLKAVTEAILGFGFYFRHASSVRGS